MNRKRITIILLVCAMLIASGIFLLGQRTDTKRNQSGSIDDNITQENNVEENELPIISPTSNNQDESKNKTKNETTGTYVSDETEGNSTSHSSNNTDNSEEEPSGTEEKENSDEVSEDTPELDDKLDMELPFVPAT